jgi:hypothetical protein
LATTYWWNVVPFEREVVDVVGKQELGDPEVVLDRAGLISAISALIAGPRKVEICSMIVGRSGQNEQEDKATA